jgi:hypothetical protein
MKRTFLGALLAAGLLMQSGPPAQACGDKLLALGRGVRFQRAFAAAHPAAVLIYTAAGSRSALTRDKELQAALRSAGHKLVSVEDSKSLPQLLGSEKYDVVFADLTEAAGVTQTATSSTSHPSVVPVMYKPEKAALAAAAKQYSFVVKAPARPVDFLAVIDEVMKRRTAARRS